MRRTSSGPSTSMDKAFSGNSTSVHKASSATNILDDFWNLGGNLWLFKENFLYTLSRFGVLSLYANCFNHSSPTPPKKKKKVLLQQENFRKLKGRVKKDEEQDCKVTKGPRKEWCVFSPLFSLFNLTILCFSFQGCISICR